jgi:hypothetical protein
MPAAGLWLPSDPPVMLVLDDVIGHLVVTQM